MGDINLTPSEAMASAATRGLELAESSTSIEPAAKARARKIASGEDLTPSVVGRMKSFFSENKIDRVAGWEKTTVGIMHQLWGGDAGKVWAQGRAKDLVADGVVLDEPTREFAEMYFDATKLAEGKVKVDEDGLIWKPMLVEGVWKIGPNGRPLRVIAGKSPDQRQAIGMADIVAAHNAKAIAHSTVPKSHNDAVDENTGYVDKVKIVKHGKKSVLMGGHRFTDATIKQKVIEGSIANTSVGLEFDYVRKDDGQKFPIVLRHNALTNSPWLGRKLPTFGLGEDVEIDGVKCHIECAEYFEEFDDSTTDHDHVDLWDGALTFGEVRDAVSIICDAEVIDLATDRVLLKKDEKNFVAMMSVVNGEPQISDRSTWVERPVRLSESDVKSTSGSEGTITQAAEVPSATTETKKEAPVADKNENEGTPPITTPTVVDLSENPAYIAQQEQIAAQQAVIDQMAQKARENEADKFIGQLKGVGLDEEHGCTGFLKKIRAAMVSDTGQKAVNLSEGDGAPRQLTLSETLVEILAQLPFKDGKLEVKLSEQASDPFHQATQQRPPLTPEPGHDGEMLSEEQRIAIADSWMDEHMPATKTQEV